MPVSCGIGQKLHVRLKRIRMPGQPRAGARCRAERIAPELQGQGILLLRVRIPGRAASGWQVRRGTAGRSGVKIHIAPEAVVERVGSTEESQ